MIVEIQEYIEKQSCEDRDICNLLAGIISKEFSDTENKMWHSHPVWFINGNPIVGFSKQKAGIRLMFWSGADFDEKDLNVLGAKFKDASIFYNHPEEINQLQIVNWLKKARVIQWDYKNLVKKKGLLERIPTE